MKATPNAISTNDLWGIGVLSNQVQPPTLAWIQSMIPQRLLF